VAVSGAAGVVQLAPTPLPKKEGAKAVTTVRTVIHDRRIEIPAPADLADGTQVILTIGTDVTFPLSVEILGVGRSVAHH
jgi:hypothetical protein